MPHLERIGLSGDVTIYIMSTENGYRAFRTLEHSGELFLDNFEYDDDLLDENREDLIKLAMSEYGVTLADIDDLVLVQTAVDIHGHLGRTNEDYSEGSYSSIEVFEIMSEYFDSMALEAINELTGLVRDGLDDNELQRAEELFPTLELEIS